mmetsp:Transcript_23875/g.42356  ORF Transcript_23875/g.42356 Transcript_23875/m.42356 type:complete len:114 (+) Transcript_23875:149-490(+)
MNVRIASSPSRSVGLQGFSSLSRSVVFQTHAMTEHVSTTIAVVLPRLPALLAIQSEPTKPSLTMTRSLVILEVRTRVRSKDPPIHSSLSICPPPSLENTTMHRLQRPLDLHKS